MHLYTVAIDPYFASTITVDVYAEYKEKHWKQQNGRLSLETMQGIFVWIRCVS